MPVKRRRRKGIIMIIALLLVAALVLVALSTRLQTTVYTFKTLQLPTALDGFRVVQLADLHGAWFGDRQEKLVAAVAAAKPDVIVLTGDIIDRKDTTLAPVQALLEGIAGLAPVYAVSGNHEEDNPALQRLLARLYQACGVTLLENEMAELRLAGGSVYIGGLASGLLADGACPAALPTAPQGSLGILLYHQTNHYEAVVASNLGYGYVFSGHTHGGIIRLPFAGGLVDNELNFFPIYDSGVFDQKTPAMVSSRGLGNSSGVPVPRVNNRPEVVCVVFETA